MIEKGKAVRSDASLDDTDLALVRLLASSGRTGVTELARQVHLSQPAVSARLQRLHRSGVITGYAAKVDLRRLGLTIHAVARLRTTQAQVAPALALFAELPEVVRIYRLTGEDCFLLDLHAVDAERLEAVVDAVARFGPVTTSLVLREYPADPVPL